MHGSSQLLRPPSDHYDGRRFFNPGVETDKSLADLWRWRRSRAAVAWPARVLDPPQPLPPAEIAPGAIALTLIGHASVLIQTQQHAILTDPMFSHRAGPAGLVGPRRVRAPAVALAQLPRIDLVLLSHNHYDHMDLPSLRRLDRAFAPPIVTGLGNGRTLAGAGLRHVTECDWWEGCEPCPGLRVTYVPAQHWSSRTGFDRRRALWGGLVVETAAGTAYFAGDTGYGPHFAAIAARCRPDVALLPIGAYAPRWMMAAQHMNPEEAVRAHLTLGVGLSIGIHWGTFQLTDEAIEAPRQDLALARAALGVPQQAFEAPDPGRTLVWRRG